MVLQYTKENGIASITLNRPDKYNSFTREMALAMQEALSDAREDPAVRALVITGSGKAFSAGQDLVEATSLDGPAIESIVSEHYNPIIEAIRSLPKPIIAKVNGVAAGAGANIALACDIVVVGESASFIQAFSKIGLIPDSGGTYILPRLVGWAKATALTMLGTTVSAQEAVQMGMIYQAVADVDLDHVVGQLAQQLATMPTYALGLTKEALNESMNHTLTQQLSLERDLQLAASQSADYKEGTAAFLEKRKPAFVGR